MKIELRFYATLKNYENADASYQSPKENLTIKDILDELAVDTSLVKIIFINGLHANLNSSINDGDRVGIFPPVGGG